MLSPVSGWVGDHLWTGKPPRCRTRHPGLLSLSLPSVVRLEWVPGESWRVNRHVTWYTSAHRWSRSVRWCVAVGLACGDQHRHTRSGSALEVLCDDALYKYTFALLTLLLETVVMSFVLSLFTTCELNVLCLIDSGETMYVCEFCLASLPSNRCLKRHTVSAHSTQCYQLDHSNLEKISQFEWTSWFFDWIRVAMVLGL